MHHSSAVGLSLNSEHLPFQRRYPLVPHRHRHLLRRRRRRHHHRPASAAPALRIGFRIEESRRWVDVKAYFA